MYITSYWLCFSGGLQLIQTPITAWPLTCPLTRLPLVRADTKLGPVASPESGGRLACNRP